MPAARLLHGLFALALVLAGCGDARPPALMAETAAPTIRVRLGAMRASARLRVRGQQWSMHGGTRRTSREALDATCRATPSGIALGAYGTGSDRLRLVAERQIEVDGKRYAGAILVTRHGQKLEVVNEIDLETYVAGVIGHELGPGATPAAHRALAVAARTYAYQKLHGADTKAFHVYDSTRSQVYGGLDVPQSFGITYADMVRATASSRGVILTYAGRPIHAYYSSSCGGHTTTPAISHLDAGHATSPLRGVPCPHCKPSQHYNNKYFQWSKAVSEADIAARLKQRGQGITLPIHDMRVQETGRGGWAKTVAVTYGPSRRVKVLRGTTFRSVAKLRSHRIAAIKAKNPGHWQVSGRGWGHGVGLCQVGAINMGHRGATESEILRYYFPEVSFTRVY